MKIQKINVTDIKAIDVPRILKENDVQYDSIDVLNWPNEFSYCPRTCFGMAHTDDAVLLHFKTSEKDVRAFVGEDLGDVWTDACVEFFIAPAGDGKYYNIECNCIGKILFAVGEGREGRIRAEKDVVARIDRWASLGSEPFDEKREETAWEVALVIPYSVFFAHDIKSLSDVKGNLYKCGGDPGTPTEHYVSWSPISTPNPDFHRPEYFGTLEFN